MDAMRAVEQCDVSDPLLLDRFRQKREQWLSLYSFNKNDPNSIEGQIVSMVFLDLSYRMIAMARGNVARGPDIAARNLLLEHLLDNGYLATQVLAIRRLLDKRGDVCSLRRLFDDIRRNNELITRENFVAYDGCPYDPDSWRSVSQGALEQIWGIEAPSLFRFLRSSERHKTFDKLAGVGAANRHRKDQISNAVYDRLESWLATPEAKKLVKLSHKFLAHASDLSHREGLVFAGVPFKDIETIHQAIVRVERAITDDILYIGVAREVVAMPPLGFLAGLDRAYAPSEVIAEMETRWAELVEHRNKWKDDYEAELYST
jgi:hypothetical protein